MNKLLFFCIASAILIFSLIGINLAPIINFKVGNNWYDASCSKISDKIKYTEDSSLTKLGLSKQEDKDERISDLKRDKNRCNRRKAMAGLEYTAFNLNLILGFTCTFLGFLNYFDIKKIEITGLIGLGSGVVGFVLTLVYVIESGLVFNDSDSDNLLRLDSDGAILEWKGNSYKCIFYDKNDKFSLYRRFSDYGNKYYNYIKEVEYMIEDENYKFQQCVSPYGSSSYIKTLFENCKDLEEEKSTSSKQPYVNGSTKLGDCDKLYYFKGYDDYSNKNLYDRWLTTIIFSCFILLLNIGLAVFGFLLFNSSGQTNI